MPLLHSQRRQPACTLPVILMFLLGSAAPAQTGPAASTDPFTVGQHWRGKTREDGAFKNIRIVERRSDMTVLEVDGFAAGAVFQFTAKVSGARASVQGVRRTENAKGHGSVQMADPSGTIRVVDGKLTVQVAARMRGSGARSWSFVCDDAELQVPAPAAAQPDPLPVGRRWSGKTREDNQPKDIRIVERRGDLVVIEVPGFLPDARFRFEGKLKDRVVVIDNVRRIKQPKGSDAVAIHEPKGTVTILPSGSISVHVEARMHGNGRSTGWTFVCPRADVQ